jgi:hypothetical protein
MCVMPLYGNDLAHIHDAAFTDYGRKAPPGLLQILRSNTLTRRIISFRKTGSRYRRSEEIHRLHLYEAAEIIAIQNRTGFHVERLRGYGRFRLPVGIAAFLARK